MLDKIISVLEPFQDYNNLLAVPLFGLLIYYLMQKTDRSVVENTLLMFSCSKLLFDVLMIVKKNSESYQDHVDVHANDRHDDVHANDRAENHQIPRGVGGNKKKKIIKNLDFDFEDIDTWCKTPTAHNIKKDRPFFIPSNKFTGTIDGYIFKTDKQGVGYYVDCSAATVPRA